MTTRRRKPAAPPRLSAPIHDVDEGDFLVRALTAAGCHAQTLTLHERVVVTYTQASYQDWPRRERHGDKFVHRMLDEYRRPEGGRDPR